MSTSGLLRGSHRAAEVDALCSLLRTELSACETYRTAIHAVEQGADCPALSLRCLYRSHRKFADELRELVRRLGGHPTESVGAWGVWSGVHERIAAMPGAVSLPTTLRALRHGEMYSLDVARGALHDLDGPPETFVKERFIAGIVANLELLAALDRAANDAPEEIPGA